MVGGQSPRWSGTLVPSSQGQRSYAGGPFVSAKSGTGQNFGSLGLFYLRPTAAVSTGMPKRRRFKQTSTLEERLAEATEQLRQQAKILKPGPALDQVNKRIRQNETAANMTEWLNSPGLKAPT